MTDTSGIDHFWAVIPAGGSGTRLWPLSRAHRPKFLLPLAGDASLLQMSIARLASLAPPDRTLVVCGPAHAAAVARQAPSLPDHHIVVEPMPRGSGPAIALAAALIARRDQTAVMGSFAADHDIRDEHAFHAAVRAAVVAARAGWLTTIGLAPTRPETGYGYIERSDDVVARSGDLVAYRAARFVEKPDRERAETFVTSGRFLWNASMFIWRVDVFLAELRRLQPELATGVTRIAAAWDTRDHDRVMARVWPALPDVAIDHAVMEHAERVAVVPAEMGWSDVGDWNGLGLLQTLDEHGNAVRGQLVTADTHNSVIWSETDRTVAIVGLSDIVVVDTADALLVARRDASQDVKQIVEMLKQAHLDDRI
jgi:mannose-1-phosphate guanylyltransferase